MKKNMKNKKGDIRFLQKIVICLTLLFMMFLLNDASCISFAKEEKDHCYLSDIKYMSGSSVGWGSITLDKNLDSNTNGGLITLLVDGQKKKFLKGISAHATSTLLYDLTDYDYDYFTAYLGVDQGRGNNGDGVQFAISTSVDGENWILKTPNSYPIMKGNTEARFEKIDIKGAKYLKLYAWARSNNTADHAVYADAKLIKEGYVENTEPVDYIKTVEAYDAIIKSHDGKEISGEYELAILQRDLVNNVGYDILQAYVKLGGEKEKAFTSVFKNAKNLSLFTTGGKPEGGNYIKSFDVLAKLYEAHEADLSNTTLIDANNPAKGTLGDLYQRMMYAISLTHSGKVYLWITGGNISDPVERYEIYKDLYTQNLIESRVFETLTVEELRWLMNTVIDNEEIKWLNNFTRTKKNGATGPYSYINYTFNYNYNKDQYYDPANYAKWDAKYDLSKYNITYKKGNPKLWIVFEEGSVCGGLSKTGSCVWGSFKGLPNTCVSQPGHCAYIYYNKNAQGKGVWGLGNDVSRLGSIRKNRTFKQLYPFRLGQ